MSALQDLNKVLESLPDWGYPLSLRGAVYRALKSNTKAILDLDRALENIRDRAFNIDHETKALCNRGAVYNTLGKYNEALADLNKVLLRDPSNVVALCERSIVYDALGKKEKALLDIDKAVTLDPGNEVAINQQKKLKS
ncbi:7263_t:CDS:2 [Racocetra fulgida]|uniref:7263_t:CDS:1 n=1 Tax=Racocetra fulgida TaxID=60492 RepID=A0A9N9I1V9_9GLOM|nr:7263_t:CDS:2 [Racocetra fulgida]